MISPWSSDSEYIIQSMSNSHFYIIKYVITLACGIDPSEDAMRLKVKESFFVSWAC